MFTLLQTPEVAMESTFLLHDGNLTISQLASEWLTSVDEDGLEVAEEVYQYLLYKGPADAAAAVERY